MKGLMKETMNVDYYQVLELKRDATAEEIQRAYRALALRYHPDRNPAPDAAVRMVAINKAYEVLGEPERRRSYDARSTPADCKGDYAAAVLLAARDVVLRAGATVIHDHQMTLLLEQGRQRIRVILTERADNDLLRRIPRYPGELIVVLTVSVEGPIPISPPVAVVDLMRSEQHGVPLPDGPCKSLFAAFL
jgi:hypothetical protein